MSSVLILCTGNSARSQMAEGLFRHAAPPAWQVFSAGTEPSPVRPDAITAMQEIGIDISAQRSKSITAYAYREFDYVITVCDHAKEVCPVFPGKTRRLHWPFEDPAGKGIEVFRRVRDQLRAKIEEFLGGTAA